MAARFLLLQQIVDSIPRFFGSCRSKECKKLVATAIARVFLNLSCVFNTFASKSLAQECIIYMYVAS